MERIQTGARERQWTPEEDEKLTTYIKKHGDGNWQALPELAGLNRSWKSCTLRWMNYLRPIKRENFSPEEELIIVQLHSLLGDQWPLIAGRLAGRTDNEIKNFWHIHLKKKLIQMGIDPDTHRRFSQGRTDNDEVANFNSFGEREGISSHQPIQGESQGNSTNFQSTKVAEGFTPSFQEEISRNSDPDSDQLPLQSTDMTRMRSNGQALEYEDAKSDNYQAKFSVVHREDFMSPAEANKSRVANDAGFMYEPQKNLESLEDVVRDCAQGVGSQPFSIFSSTQPDNPGNIPKQGHQILGELSTNGIDEGKEFGGHLSNQGELRGTTSTQYADVALNSIMDYTNEFSNYKIFESKEALIQCTRKVGRKNGFVIVIQRSDLGNSRQRARVTLCCERGGRYRNTRKNKGDKKEKQFRSTSTKKCACPFTLKGYELDDENWILEVKCGVHNHPVTKLLEGRSYAGTLTKEETLLLEDMFKSKIRPKDILAALKNRDVHNISTTKHIYNARQRYKVKEMSKSSNNTLKSNLFHKFFPVGLRSYIDHVKDMTPDGHCGFRAIADLMGFGENEWPRVREDLLNELKSNSKHYSLLYQSDERVKELIDALSYFESFPSSD